MTSGELLELPSVTDPRGSLTYAEVGKQIPFAIRRAFYLYDLPVGASRGGHAHKELHQLIIAIAGSFKVVLDDTSTISGFHLDRPDRGLHVCPMVWADLSEFSPGAVCLVLASDVYDERDYYRDYAAFLTAACQS